MRSGYPDDERTPGRHPIYVDDLHLIPVETTYLPARKPAPAVARTLRPKAETCTRQWADAKTELAGVEGQLKQLTAASSASGHSPTLLEALKTKEAAGPRSLTNAHG